VSRDSNDLQQLRDQVVRLNGTITAVGNQLSDLVTIETARRELALTQARQDKKRRSAIGFLIIGILVLAQIEEEAYVQCATVRNKIENLNTLHLCNVAFPLHTHAGADWPARYNIIGMVTYASIFLAMGTYAYLKNRQTFRRARGGQLPPD
jgi:hypothetical protein